MADPIIEELWQIKDAIAEEHNYDVDALIDHLQEQGKNRKNTVVDLAARKRAARKKDKRAEE